MEQTYYYDVYVYDNVHHVYYTYWYSATDGNYNFRLFGFRAKISDYYSIIYIIRTRTYCIVFAGYKSN